MVAVDIPNGKKEFSPSGNEEPHQNNNEGEYNEDDEFEDIDPPDNKILRQMKEVQDSMSEHWQTNKRTYYIVIGVVLLLAYFAYFAYAMYHSFGDEGSVR